MSSQDEDEKKFAKLSLEYLVAAYGVDKLNDPAKAEPVLIKMIEMEPTEPSNYAVLAKIYEDAGLYDDAEKVLLMSKSAKPKDSSVYLQLAGFYNRQGKLRQDHRIAEPARRNRAEQPRGVPDHRRLLLGRNPWRRLPDRCPEEGIHRPRSRGGRQGALAEA